MSMKHIFNLLSTKCKHAYMLHICHHNLTSCIMPKIIYIPKYMQQQHYYCMALLVFLVFYGMYINMSMQRQTHVVDTNTIRVLN